MFLVAFNVSIFLIFWLSCKWTIELVDISFVIWCILYFVTLTCLLLDSASDSLVAMVTRDSQVYIDCREKIRSLLFQWVSNILCDVIWKHVTYGASHDDDLICQCDVNDVITADDVITAADAVTACTVCNWL